MRTCLRCKKTKSLDDYWRCKSCRGQKDYICAECRRRAKLEKSKTPLGIYETKARLLTNCFRRDWFSEQSASEHLDHVFSIRAGFECKVPLDVLCNRNNLRLIPRAENLRKGAGCDCSLQELYAGAEPDEKLSRLARIIEKQNDPDALLRWSILVNVKNRGGDTI
jgi:hypothetical protein